MTQSPTVAVIIPARNEAGTIAACLASVQVQGWPADRLEVYVIDDGSTDETATMARRHGATVLATGGVGPSHGRNLALRQTAADLCLFTDGDCELQPGFLRELVAALEEAGPSCAGTGGRQVAFTNASPYARQVQRFLEVIGLVSDYVKGSSGPGRTTHNPSCCSLLRRSAVLGVGGFQEGLWPCEDLELDLRLRQHGFHLRYVPAATVAHHRPNDPTGFARMMRNYGRGHAGLVRLHGPSRVLHLLPAVTVASCGLAPAAAVATAPVWMLPRLGLHGADLAELPALMGMLSLTLWEWHLGFAEGLAGRSAIAPAP